MPHFLGLLIISFAAQKHFYLDEVPIVHFFLLIHLPLEMCQVRKKIDVNLFIGRKFAILTIFEGTVWRC